MEAKQIADLDIETIIALAGMPLNKDIINPKNPAEMAERVRVTFKPVPHNYFDFEVKKYRGMLKDSLIENGVKVVDWKEATTEGDTYGFFSRLFRIRKVRRNIHAVVAVRKEPSIVRRFFMKMAEDIYSLVRNDERSVSEILKISGWADNFTIGNLQDPYNTQVITLMTLDPEFEDEKTTYDKKISIGLKNLINSMSEIVIGVSYKNFAIINMNLSDSIYKHSELNSFVRNSLVPKIYAPIK
ncbi:MAG: hypothetical protein ACRENO_08955, partial [Thermodesulfobacteriota bacterium]